ncbi:alpha/beta hydrolase family protein [Sphingopyxis sp. QXT-31]|uniref:alpha/beta hydrolase family protein n=1 Tax=Sphingopyxis sp. QXT-31 TaxID=1357916 RepID=UPI0012EB6397|nr:S9 family peptidase [Sphingopyxis sp. QXT-31]
MSGRAILKWITGALLLAGTGPGAMAAEPAAKAAEERPARIATADLAQLPDFSDVKLSPDGQRILYRGRVGGKPFIAYRPLNDSNKVSFGIPDKAEVAWIRWAGNSRILIAVGMNVQYFGEEARGTYLVLHDTVTGVSSVIRRKDQGLEGDDVLYVDPEGQYLLLSIQKTIYDYPSVFRVTLPDGKMTEIVKARQPVWEWYADEAGIVRIGVGWEARKAKFFYRRAAEERFEMIGAVRPDEEDDWIDVARVVRGSDEGYVLSDKKTGRKALYKFNYRTREIGDLVYGNEKYDIDDYWLNDDGSVLEGASYTDDRDRVYWFDEAKKKQQVQIDKALADQQAWVTSRSRDGQRMLVLATAPHDPGAYYLLDRATREMAFLGALQASLPPEQFATTKAVSYRARDGMEIPAFLTLPKGRDPKGLPLIIFPHGGPYGVRDKLEYDAQVQLMANRGYAVLQPNYRGSGGYGTSFDDAGRGQIGVKMQDDLDDGMDWLAEQGVIDKSRVCVVGASYGGYAALWAVMRNPERYRCAASFAGVTDWAAILKYDRRFFSKKGRAKWEARVTGDATLDLSSVSPIQQVARLTRPVLIAHGDDDSIVPVSQSKKLVAALKKSGNLDFEYREYPGEGHGFSDPANQKDWFDRLDAFLAKHNPAG